jgi:methylmalonyl-CoA mutase, C-terminal domain
MVASQSPDMSAPAPAGQKIRILLTKLGLDGHDRGIKVVARALRDAGMEVIYTGLRQTPEAVVRAAAEEDVAFLGISLLSGAHMTLVPKVLALMKAEGLREDVEVFVGGIIPNEDAEQLIQMGVKKVFGPGTPLEQSCEYIQGRWAVRQGGAAGTVAS